MFDNRFNSKKTDPLVEAAKGAMMEGEIRRQAINAVNEEFGVYNRNAVIREHLAAYDARIEEAVKCMKEGKPLSPAQKAKMDVDDDEDIDADDLKILRARKGMNEKKMWEGSGVSGDDPGREVANQAAARQQAQTPSSTPAKTGNAAGATIAKAKDALNELTKPTPKTAMNAYYRAYDSDVRDGGEGKRTSRLGRWKEKHLPGKSARNQKDTGKAEMDDYDRKTVKKSGVLTKASQGETKKLIKSRLGKHTKPKHLPEETIEEAVSRKHFQQVAELIKGHESQEKRNELASHHAGIFAKQNPRFDHARFHKAAGSTAHDEPKKMEEAAYSAKAARAGKDIGKPGKSFSMIAKKAGERYGSKERGKKVAGAILKRIRAKHMKEEQIDEVVAAAALAKSGLTLGQYMNREKHLTAVKGGRNDPSSPNFAGPKPAASPKPSAATSSMDSTSTPPTKWADAGAKERETTAATTASQNASLPKVASKQDTMAADAAKSASAGPVTSPVSGPGPSAVASTSKPLPSMATSDSKAQVASTPAPGADKKKEAGELPTMGESLNEGFVSIGANRYRIV